MKALASKEERERLRKRNQVVVGVILVFLMVASTIGYAIQGNLGSSGNKDPDKLTYNGSEFTNQNGFWVLGNFVFKYNPKETPSVGEGLKKIQEYQGKPLYIQSENENAEAEIYVNLGQVAERVQKACVENTNCSGGLPIKTCNDNFIIIKESEIDSISQIDGCVYIEGSKEDLVKLADQFLFKILGIK